MKLTLRFGLPMMAVCVFLAGTLYLTGMGSGGGDEVDQDPPPAAQFDARLAPEAQQAALADGVITPEEHLAASIANAECIRKAGFEASEPRLVNGNVAQGSISFSDADYDRATTVIRTCNELYVDAINRALAIQNRPSPEKLEAARDALAACLEEAGVTLRTLGDGRRDFGSVAQTDPKFGPCSEKVSEEFGLPYFGG